jgi:hypothetical protein
MARISYLFPEKSPTPKRQWLEGSIPQAAQAPKIKLSARISPT